MSRTLIFNFRSIINEDDYDIITGKGNGGKSPLMDYQEYMSHYNSFTYVDYYIEDIDYTTRIKKLTVRYRISERQYLRLTMLNQLPPNDTDNLLFGGSYNTPYTHYIVEYTE